jgi:hypothetical protein
MRWKVIDGSIGPQSSAKCTTKSTMLRRETSGQTETSARIETSGHPE